MTNPKKAAEALTRRILGSILDDILLFFKDIDESVHDVVVFISRKAYLLYEVVKMCGIEFDERVQIVYSDRIIKRPNDDEPRFAGKNVLLVEDTINKGGKLSKVLQWFANTLPENEKYNSLKAICFACNIDILPSERYINEDDFNYLVAMSSREIRDFSVMQVKAIHLLGLVYTLELPIYSHKDLSYQQYIQIKKTLDNIVQRGWYKEDYSPELDCDDSIYTGDNSACFYIPNYINKLTLGISSNVYSEHVSFKEVSYSECDDATAEEKFYSVSIVPMALIDCISLDNAVAFFMKLAENENLSVRDALSKWFEKVIKFAENDDELLAFNIHKSLTYLLSHCVGLKFSSETVIFDGLTKKASAKKHFGTLFTEDFVYKLNENDLEIIEELLPSLATICKPDVLEKNTLSCDMGKAMMVDFTKPEISNETINANFENYLRAEGSAEKINHGRKYATSISYMLKKSATLKADGTYYAISLNKLLNQLLVDSYVNAGYIMRHIIMHEVDISAFSFDLCFVPEQRIMVKKLISGENSFLAPIVRAFNAKVVDFLTALYLGTGSYDGTIENIDILITKANPFLVKHKLPSITQSKQDLQFHLRNYFSDEIIFNEYLPLYNYNVTRTAEETVVYNDIYNSGAAVVGRV